MKWFRKKKFIRAEYNEFTEVMSIFYSDGSIKQYYGSSTVWHLLPLMKRQNTITESKLCDIYTYILKWGNPYPTAHKKHEL